MYDILNLIIINLIKDNDIFLYQAVITTGPIYTNIYVYSWTSFTVAQMHMRLDICSQNEREKQTHAKLVL